MIAEKEAEILKYQLRAKKLQSMDQEEDDTNNLDETVKKKIDKIVENAHVNTYKDYNKSNSNFYRAESAFNKNNYQLDSGYSTEHKMPQFQI